MSICKHCNKRFPKEKIGSHTRWCDLNPKRNEYIEKLRFARSAIKNPQNQYTKAKSQGNQIVSKLKGRTGTYWLGKTHSKKTKQILSQKALASKHRRLKKGVVEYKGILLDSSWELELAKRLDELQVKWTRPEPMPWVDDQGVTHNYFPDFYLPEYDLFLDPKNSHAIKVQKKKLDCILTQYKNIVIIDSLEKCKTFSP
jgi:hypothetical protein